MGLINFKMKEIAEIFPSGSSETGYVLHWFGLTDSYYWLKLDGHELFKYSTDFGNLPNPSLPYVDYHLARFIEDFYDILPSVATPIPDDLFNYIDSISKMEAFLNKFNIWLQEDWDEDDAQYDRVYLPATGWLWDRRLDSGHLRNGPDIWFFRHGSQVIIRWDCGKEANWWSETKGEFVIEYSDFLNEINEFFRAFWTRMDQQVREASTNWPFPKVQIDIQRLQNEHEERKQTINTLLNQISDYSTKHPTDWKMIIEAVKSVI